MSTTNFIDGVTPVVADWLNDVDDAVYNQLPTKVDASALAPYETIANAAATYETIVNAAATYETQVHASATFASKANNLSDLVDLSTARTNLGLVIGSTVQAYDAATAKTNVAQNFTVPQRSALLTDNDGSFDLSAKQNFKCTTAGSVTLTFSNQQDGLSGSVIFINASNHAVAAHANTKLTATDLAKLSASGTYRIDYLSDGTNAYCSVVGAYT